MFSFLDIIFPPKCLGCQQEGNIICDKCFQKIKLKKNQQCPICKLEINQGEVCEKCRDMSHLNGLLVATTYDNNPLIKRSITQFKYKFNEELSEKLGKLMCCSPLKMGLVGSFLTTNNKLQSTILVPVPLHFRRRWQRGFNQAELLAKQVSKNTNLPILNLLKRTKNTPQQAKLNRQERLNNLKEAFQVNENDLKKLQTTNNELPRIILIDDIASTLTTLEESARALKKAGFKNIWGLVIARG